jgi:hypothetical protein
VRKLGIELPALIDNFDNSTEVAYTAWPDRLYLIGRDGRIAYKSKPGPFGFKPDQLSEALKQATVPDVKVSQRSATQPLPSVAALFSSQRSRRLSEQAVPWSSMKSPGQLTGSS